MSWFSSGGLLIGSLDLQDDSGWGIKGGLCFLPDVRLWVPGRMMRGDETSGATFIAP